MQILVQLYPFLVATAVFVFPAGFLKLFLGSLVLIDSVLLLMHLTLDYNFGYGFLLFGCVNQFCEDLVLFLLVTLGIRFMYSVWFSRVFIPLLRDFRRKTSRIFPESKLSGECDDTSDVEESAGEEDDDDDEVDVLELKRLVKLERRRANEALAELEKEREASSIAAEETMALIRRLETKKSLLEMEFSHYRRLAEEEQSHYHEKIQSLQWLLFNQEEQLRLSNQKLKVILQK